jgi:cell division protein FtsB
MHDGADRQRGQPGKLVRFPARLRVPRLVVRWCWPRLPRPRWLLARRDARPLPFLSDARPTAGGAAADRPRRARLGERTLTVACAVVFLAGVGVAAFGSRGWRDVLASRREFAALKAQATAQHATVVQLRQEVQRLREGRHAVERIARETLGLVRPGEITFILPEDEPRRVAAEAPR